MSTSAPVSVPPRRPSGPRPYPRIHASLALIEHVRAHLRDRGMRFRDLCRLAFNGDDSPTRVVFVSAVLSRTAFANSLLRQTQISSIAKATGWPEGEPYLEQIETEDEGGR